MKIRTILILTTLVIALVLSGCADNGNREAWQALFFGTEMPVTATVTLASPPGDVNWEITPEPNDMFLPIINQEQGGEP